MRNSLLDVEVYNVNGIKVSLYTISIDYRDSFMLEKG